MHEDHNLLPSQAFGAIHSGCHGRVADGEWRIGRRLARAVLGGALVVTVA